MSTPSLFWNNKNYVQADMDVGGDYMFVNMEDTGHHNSSINSNIFAQRVVVSDVDNVFDIHIGDAGTNIESDSVCCRGSGSNNNRMCSGPYIPEVDCGYNVYTNGVSINFLKDPFCFRNEFLFGKNSLNENIISSNSYLGKNGSNIESLQNNVHILKPLRKTKVVEVPVYIYEEKIVHKTEVVNKNVYVPIDGPMYVTKEVKVPVYKEQIKHVPIYIEKEKIYEIPKLEINDLIQQNLLYLHKHEIQYEKNSHVIERVIPRLNTKVVEKTVQVPAITHLNVNPNTAVVAPTATNTNAKNNALGNVLSPDSINVEETCNQKNREQSKSESKIFEPENISSNVNEKPAIMVKGGEKLPEREPEKKENLMDQQEDSMAEKHEEEDVKNVEEEDIEKTEEKIEEKIEKNIEEKAAAIDEEKVEEKAEEKDAEKIEELNQLQNLSQLSSEAHKNHKQINTQNSDVSTKDINTKLQRLYSHVEAMQLNFNVDSKSVKEETKDNIIPSSDKILITTYGESKNESSISDVRILSRSNTSGSSNIL